MGRRSTRLLTFSGPNSGETEKGEMLKVKTEKGETANDQTEKGENENVQTKKGETKKRLWGPGHCSHEQPKRVKQIGEIYTTSHKTKKLDTKVFQKYFDHMWSTLPEEKQAQFSCIDPLWVSMYLKGQHQRVKSWFKRENIFKPYILVPIVHWGHWNLLILCNIHESLDVSNGPFGMLLDSLQCIDPLRAEPEIRRLIFDLCKSGGRIMKNEEISDIPLFVPKIPQQTNGEECGIFVLYYIYLFIQSALEAFTKEDYPSFLTEHWFTYEMLSEFYSNVRSRTLGRKQRSEAGSGKSVVEDYLLDEEDQNEVEESKETRSGQNIVESVEETDSRQGVLMSGKSRSGQRKRGCTSSHEVHGMEAGKRICVEWNTIGQPIGEGGRSLRTFLGTVARNVEKLPIHIPTWRKISSASKDDVWDYVKRKYDIDDCNRDFVMKDLALKWKYWKYKLRKQYFNPKLRAKQQKLPDKQIISQEQWKEAVKVWSNEEWLKKSEVNKQNKTKQKWHHCCGTRTVADIRKAEYDKSGVELDRTDLFIITHTRKDGAAVNGECALVIEKLQDLKRSQPSSSSSRPIASKDDIYAQVLGEDKSGRVRGLGTGPTPSSVWGTSRDKLKCENVRLHSRVKELEERFTRVETILQQGGNVQRDAGSPVVVSSSAASGNADIDLESKDGAQLQGKRVRLMDIDGQQVGTGIVMSVDQDKVVMGRKIGNAYCEISLTYSCKPDAPLIVKDDQRKKMRDALGSHILWLIDYVELDTSRRQICSQAGGLST